MTGYFDPASIETLRVLLASGEFHHATYRNQGTLWEGLHYYKRSESGFRGFEHAGTIFKSDPSLETAFELTRGTGISVRSYGNG